MHFHRQVRVAVDKEAPPIKVGDPVLLDIFHGGVVKPGALSPQQADALASFMAYRDVPHTPLPHPMAAGPPSLPVAGFNRVGGGGLGKGGNRQRQGGFLA